MKNTNKTLKELVIEWFLENEYELFFKMEECQHGYLGIDSNIYHLEGNIWKHTKMVLDEVEKLYLPSIEMYLVALLHDIGKPFVYFDNHETKRRRFTNHEAYSTFEAKRILDKFIREISPDMNKELVLKTISNHGRLYNYMEDYGLNIKGKEKIFQMYKKDIEAFDYMMYFYQCDHRGRITDAPRADELIMKDFKEIREKIVKYIRDNKNNSQKSKPTLRILIGPLRSGKSTFIEENMLSDTSNIISRDVLVEKYGVGDNYSEKWQSLTKEKHDNIDIEIRDNFKKLITNKENVVIDMTNMTPKSRKKWLKGVKGLDEYYKIANIFIESLDILESRNTNKKSINIDIIKNMIIRFSWPMYDEFDEVFYACSEG